MAKEKKRGFFSWLGFGQKEQAQETETEQKVEEQQAVADETPAAGAMRQNGRKRRLTRPRVRATCSTSRCATPGTARSRI